MGIVLSMEGKVWIEGKEDEQDLLNVANSCYRHPDDYYEDFKIKDIQGGIRFDKDGQLDFYCDNRFNGVTALCEYAQEFYEIPRIQKLEVTDQNRGQQESRIAIDWVLNRQETLDFCYLMHTKNDNKELTYCLDRMGNRITDYLVVDATTTKKFKYTFRQPLTPKYLQFNKAAWITIQNLYDLNCGVVFLKQASLTSENMNHFLKHWMNGGNSNLRYLYIEMRLINIDVMLNGIEAIRKNHPENITFLYDKEQESKTSFNSSYELRRSDGTIASILMDNGDDEYFEMCVWPDMYGTPYPVQESD